MVSGCLPWRTVADRQAVGWMKAEITPSKLCAECPPEFLRLYSYLKRLGWNAEPNYSILDSLLVEVQRRRHIDDSDPFVWEADDITTDNNTEDHDNWMTMEDTG